MDFTSGYVAVEAWVYLDTLPSSHQTIVVRADGAGTPNVFELHFTAAGTNRFCVFDSAGTITSSCYTTVTTAPLNRWFHIGGIYIDFFFGTYLNIFIDGNDTSGTRVSDPGFSAVGTPPSAIDVGSRPSAMGPTNVLRGRIAQVRVTDGIPPSYSIPIPPPATITFTPDQTFTSNNQTVMSWTLDEGTGTNAGDNSMRGNDGTITGATWVPGGPPCP